MVSFVYMNHETYMYRCIELARKALGNTYPNPLVGAVIVHQEKIIGEGYHQKAGEAHAEINAICSVEDPSLLPDSTIYVSLEPCAHFGKTPPCALKLKEIGFEKVVIGSMDIHDKVNGKGKKVLQNAGIETLSGILEQECEALNKRFFTFHQKKRPYLILKWAESGDGFMDKDFKPTAISNSLAKQWVHRLRAEEHAILVGTHTALVDNPSLTVREVAGKNPIRILIDFDLKVPKDFNLYNHEATTLVFNGLRDEVRENVKFIKTEKENFLDDLMAKLHEHQIQSVIIEGGAFTLHQFIEANLWDEVIIIKNENLRLGNGTQAPKFNEKPLEIKKLRDNKVFIFKKCSSVIKP